MLLRLPAAGLAVITLAACGRTPSPPPEPTAAALPATVTAPPAGWQEIWRDDFDGTALDRTKWSLPSYQEREGAHINTEGTITVADGHLRLATLVRAGEVHCAIIDTRGTFRRRHGWFEARIRLQQHQGHHGAFWLQSPDFRSLPDNPAAAGTEMDIIEWFGAGRRDGWAGMNIYWHHPDGPRRCAAVPDFTRMGGPAPGDRATPLADLSSGFRNYGLLWTAAGCVFLCDGVEIMRETTAVSGVPQYMILSLLSSQWERARLPLDKLPDAMEVDWVRVLAPP